MSTVITESQIPTVRLDYHVEAKEWVVTFEDRPNNFVLQWGVKDNMRADFKGVFLDVSEKLADTQDKLSLEEKKVKDLSEQMNSTIETIRKKFEEQLNEERELRTEAEKLNEHLQDEISKLRRDIQRWYESNSGHVSSPAYTFIELPSTPVQHVSGTVVDPAVSPRRPDTISGGVTKKDDSV